MLEIKDKRAKGLCTAKYCSKKPGSKDRFCPKHRHRFKKENNFVAYTYGYFKQNARRRGKEFYISLCEFKLFCLKTGYLQGKGKERNSMSIDRIDHTKGYTIDNIQILSLSNNSKKQHDERHQPF